MSVDPLRNPPRPLALAQGEAARQRQTSLLAATGPQASALSQETMGELPGAAPQPAPVAASDQVSISPQARQSLAAESAPAQGAKQDAARAANAARIAPLRPEGPASGVAAPALGLIRALVEQVTAPVMPQQVLSVQPWTQELARQVAATGLPSAPLPAQAPTTAGAPQTPVAIALQNWLVRQGTVQTSEGPRGFSLTLQVPAAWLQASARDRGASAGTAAPAAQTPVAGFAGKAQALPSGLFALVLQALNPPPEAAPLTSGLLLLEWQPMAQTALAMYGRDGLQQRTDPWLQQAVLQASGWLHHPPESSPQEDPGLCQTPGCPYMGRAPCPQPFCPALPVVAPVAAL